MIVHLQGLPKKRCYLPVVPQSPALQLKRRCLNSRSHDLEEDAASDHVIKATPMPSFEAVFVPERPHKATELQPFEFERRDRDKPSKETLVQMIMRKTDFKVCQHITHRHNYACIYILCAVECSANAC